MNIQLSFFHGVTNFLIGIFVSTVIQLFPFSASAVFSGTVVTDPLLLKSIVQLGNNEFNCTGFLIDKYTVITAAHCVEDEDGKKNPSIIYQFGDSGDKITSILSIGYTQSSKTRGGGEDIAAVYAYSPDGSSKFQNSVPFEIERPENLTSADEICVLGVGASESTDGVQSLKMRCGLRADVASDGILFVGDPLKTDDQNAGKGDSGGPILKKLHDGSYKVVGVISSGPRTDLESNPFGKVTIGANITAGPAKVWLDKKNLPLKF
jgi:hypothetical protein